MPTWTVKPLGDVCTLQRGFDLPSQDRRPGAYPLVSSSGVIDTHDEGRVSGPGVVTGRSGSIGNVFYIEEDFWPLNTTLYVRDFHNNDPRFVHYLLTALDLRQFAGGTGVPTLNRNDVHSVAVPTPSSVDEQRRIVAILDEAFEGIATTKANAERNLRNALALLDAARRTAFEALAHEHGLAALRTCCDFENGDRGKNYPGKEHRVAIGVPFINAGHLSEDGVDFSKMDYISTERFELLGNGKIRPRDVLFCLRGSLGKFACVNDLQYGAIASSLVILRPRANIVTAYLLEFLASPFCADQIELRKGGAAQPNLGAKDLKLFELPLPPTEKQVHIASHLVDLSEATSELRSLLSTKVAALDELKSSLLHQAFTGQLTAKCADEQVAEVA